MKQQISKADSRNWLTYIAAGVLFLTSMAQSIRLLEKSIVPGIDRVLEVGRESALDRSGILFAGKGFNDFLVFVREVVPEDGLVVIPRFEQDQLYGHEGIMEYFLFPRRVANCSPTGSVEECILDLRGHSTYFLAVNGFPPSSAAMQVKEYVPFEVNRGIYIPIP